MKNQLLFITCEHGGNTIPDPYKPLFVDAEQILATHRGYDIGALAVATQLGEELADFHYYATTSRLLVELNRSLGHSHLWSEFTNDLSKKEKKLILEQYYFPYRNNVETAIKHAIEKDNRVVHISVHSFTPEMNGEVRNAEIGLLYDSTRKLEKQFCMRWKKKLEEVAPQWRTRCNYPYRGSSDGFTTYLRKRCKKTHYIGIELEMNQSLLAEMADLSKVMNEVVKQSLKMLLNDDFLELS
jgi:predicted N-formylglutamate amidohydrolase